MRLLPAAAAVLLASLSYPQPAPREQVGPLPGGGFLLNSGWRLQPAGRQIPLDTLPIASALSPDGKYLLVLNAGYNPPSISVLEVAGAEEVSRTPVPDGWLGLVFAPKGNLVYVGGGSQAAVFEFSFSAGKLEPARTFPVVEASKRTPRDFIGDVALSPDGRLIYAADLDRKSVV
jgi:DNA-binding beta-propeller fold protein YncE